MNKVLLSLCLLALCAASAPCFADAAHGTLVEERIVRLPADENKWYVSVVGCPSDARYRELLGWFEMNASLKKLKDQVHWPSAPSPLPENET